MSASGSWGDDSDEFGISFNVPADQMRQPLSPVGQGSGTDQSPRPGTSAGAWDPTPQRLHGSRDHPQGLTILVVGILSIVLCPLLGPFAWTMGNKAMREIRFSGYHVPNAGLIKAGRILGIIASVLMVAWAALVVLLVGRAIETVPAPTPGGGNQVTVPLPTAPASDLTTTTTPSYRVN